MTNTGPETPPAEPSWDQPGGLGIEERRSWPTWQLVAAIVVAALIGMAIGHSGGGSSSAAGGAGGGQTARTLPPDSSGANSPTHTSTTGASSTSTSSAAGTSGARASTTTTTTGSGSATTTTKPGASTTTAPSGPPSYLIRNLQGTGPKALPAFSIAGGKWTIGWAYRCVLAPGGAAKFVITAGATKAVNEQGRDGSGTTPQSKAGAQQLRIVTDPACEWAITVVGVGG